MNLSHLDSASRARMVDVSGKDVSQRRALAQGRVEMSIDAYELVASAALAKGDVLTVAEVAGVMAAKQTGGLIPLCHPVPLDRVEVVVTPDAGLPGVSVTATARATASTGVEMEALTACSVACLTIYDMCKSSDRGMTMGEIALWEKTGGRSGTYRRSDGLDDDLGL